MKNTIAIVGASGKVGSKTAQHLLNKGHSLRLVARHSDKLAPFKESVKFGRWPGYPGPPSRKSSEALVKYILVDMYAQAIKGMKPEDAVKWAEAELKKAYA